MAFFTAWSKIAEKRKSISVNSVLLRPVDLTLMSSFAM